MEEKNRLNQYTIEINNTEFEFSCDDGEEHVMGLQRKISNVISLLARNNKNNALSKYSMKVALLLADDALREEGKRLEQEAQVEQRLVSLLDDLDRVL